MRFIQNRKHLVLLIVSAGMFVLTVFLSSYYLLNQPFPAFQSYISPIIAGMGVTIGLIGVVTMFYLGKTHDYLRESIKYKGELREIKEKIRILLNDPHLKWEYQEEDKTFEEKYLIDEKMDKHLSSMPKRTLEISLLILALIVIAIVGILINSGGTSLGNIINLFASLIVGIIFFLVIWCAHEDNISLFNNNLEQKVNILVEWKCELYKLEKKML